MTEVKLTKLTNDNVRALRETMSSEQAAKVRLTATTAVFEMSATEAAIMVSYLQSQAAQDHGAMGHPYKSLTAVRRKLEALEASETSATASAPPSSPTQKAPQVLAELLRLDNNE